MLLWAKIVFNNILGLTLVAYDRKMFYYFANRTMEEALELIKGYRNQIIFSQASFQDLALNYSEDMYAPQGGNMGEVLVIRNQTSAFDKAAWDLKVGEVSQPFVDIFGVSIVSRSLWMVLTC